MSRTISVTRVRGYLPNISSTTEDTSRCILLSDPAIPPKAPTKLHCVLSESRLIELWPTVSRCSMLLLSSSDDVLVGKVDINPGFSVGHSVSAAVTTDKTVSLIIIVGSHTYCVIPSF